MTCVGVSAPEGGAARNGLVMVRLPCAVVFVALSNPFYPRNLIYHLYGFYHESMMRKRRKEQRERLACVEGLVKFVRHKKWEQRTVQTWVTRHCHDRVKR
jgi:hypothetical protein